jgi:dephospho-CoA kinase
MVTIVEADPEWPAEFERIRSQLRDALGSTALGIEHIGSTSVPGLPSKDVIDVQIAVVDEEALELVSTALTMGGGGVRRASGAIIPSRGSPWTTRIRGAETPAGGDRARRRHLCRHEGPCL